MQSAILAVTLSLVGACPCENSRPAWQMPYYQPPFRSSYQQPYNGTCYHCPPRTETYECDECDEYGECCQEPIRYKPVYEKTTTGTKCRLVPETVTRAGNTPAKSHVDSISSRDIPNIQGINAVLLRRKLEAICSDMHFEIIQLLFQDNVIKMVTRPDYLTSIPFSDDNHVDVTQNDLNVIYQHTIRATIADNNRTIRLEVFTNRPPDYPETAQSVPDKVFRDIELRLRQTRQ